MERNEGIFSPLGEICVIIDGKKVTYDYFRLQLDKCCEAVSKRYRIVVNFEPTGSKHQIACCFEAPDNQAYEQSSEPGERLECNSFYVGNVKLSIGIESDAGYLNEERISDAGYDYDSEYLKNGIAYVTLPGTKTNMYVFGISWNENNTMETDVQTWYGADPTMPWQVVE